MRRLHKENPGYSSFLINYSIVESNIRVDMRMIVIDFDERLPVLEATIEGD